MAALELGKRRKLQERPERATIRSSKDIYEIFHPLLCDLAHEEFWVLLLNQASRVIDKSRISRGGIDQTTADVRSILREALIQRATQIALIHNHPSGSPRPSTDDQRLTQLVQKGAQTMNIRLIDHVIVTDGKYYSFKCFHLRFIESYRINRQVGFFFSFACFFRLISILLASIKPFNN